MLINVELCASIYKVKFKRKGGRSLKNNTKRIVIIVSNAIAIMLNLVSLFSIIMVKLLSPYIEEYRKLSENINILPQSIIISVCIIFSILSIIFSIKIEKNKTKMGLCILATTMMGTLYNVIAGVISIIVLYKKNKEDEEIVMPNLPEIKNKIIIKILYLLLFIALFALFYVGLLTVIIGNVIISWNFVLKVVVIYLLQMILIIVPFIQNLIRDTKYFIKNRKVYFEEMVKITAYTVLCYIPIALIMKLIIGETSTNQNNLQMLPVWFMCIIGIFVAPICEEIMFRGFLRKILKNNIAFIIISAVIFGAIHCMYIETNLLMYLYVIPYAIMGAGLAKIYTKTDNIWSNILIHMGWNLIAVISSLLIGA